MSNLFIGIDPGSSGAVALWWPASRRLEVHDMPTVTETVSGKPRQRVDMHALQEILTDTGEDRAALVLLEKVSARPREAPSASFQFGRTVGRIEGCLAWSLLRWDTVTPAKWKGAFKLSADKGVARELAQRMFPDSAGEFRLVKHADRAEAALIALYAQRITEGNG